LDGQFRGLFNERGYIRGTSYIITDEEMMAVAVDPARLVQDRDDSMVVIGCNYVSTDIPRSRDDPELRWVYDTEVVGDLIAVSAPVPGHVVAQEVQHCAAEVREGAVALVVGGMSVHQPP